MIQDIALAEGQGILSEKDWAISFRRIRIIRILERSDRCQPQFLVSARSHRPLGDGKCAHGKYDDEFCEPCEMDSPTEVAEVVA
jgi:hypothetical protein